MNDRLHIIITGEEGKGRTMLLSKRKLQRICIISVFVFLTLAAISYNASHLFLQNNQLNSQVVSLHNTLTKSDQVKEEYARTIDTLQQQNSTQAKIFQMEKQTLQDNADNASQQLQKKYSQKISSLQRKNTTQAEAFQVEKQTLLNTAVSELEERSNVIERMLSNIGVDIKDVPKPNNNNSGGPFLAPKEEQYKELLFRSDAYLKIIRQLPLGPPTPGRITSHFGHRTDPINNKKGFHSGVDIRGRYGQKIIATADGIVCKAYFNGGYGRFVEIDHDNGYTSRFAHMKNTKVKRGDKVVRGQVVGTVGSSGRSTGSHLHYEICLHDKPINPSRFMEAKNLIQAATMQQLGPGSKVKIKRTLVSRDQPVNILQR